jgi:signal transduction histidine kinase/DNA-binding response OmpR family regulator
MAMTRLPNPAQVDLQPPLSENAWPIAGIVETRAIEVLSDLTARFGVLPSGKWTEPPRSAIALPLASPGESPYGVLIAGVSPHRTLDDGYKTFFELAAAQVVTAIRNANAHEEQRLRAEKLAEIDRAKTAFFSNISHEFRTPLTLMLGPLEDALSGASRSLSGDSLDVTYRGAVRLLKLVNTLLDFSRIEAGRLQASYEPVDLASITVELAGVFRSAIERAGLRLVVRCEPLAEPVYVDQEMWEKIVLNLVSNAFKFTFEGEIEVALRSAKGHVELVVRDTGIGVSAQELPRLFERFHRVEGARARTHEGSGIGLSFVQELVRLHGGEISAKSQHGRGTAFSVKIPTGTQHLPKDRIVAARPHAPAGTRAGVFLDEALRWLPDTNDSPLEATPPAERDQPKATARILVVDDNADLRDYLRRILGARWQVETAANGEAALEAARHSPPDLVLTDVMMPGLSGFGLLSELRRDARTHSIPVIMLSARAGEEARVEGLDAGADDYLIKPFSARELIARVSSQLALSASYRERALLVERELVARKEADLQKQHVASLFTLAPTPIVILRGPKYVIELANPEACRIWGRRYEDVINKPLLEALPELSGQVFASLLDGVISTGVPYLGKETPAEVDRRGDGTLERVYFNFVYAPLRNVAGDIDGVFVFAFDVTDEVVLATRCGGCAPRRRWPTAPRINFSRC